MRRNELEATALRLESERDEARSRERRTLAMAAETIETLKAENERLRSYLALIADGDTPRDSVDLHEAKELAREALAEGGAHAP